MKTITLLLTVAAMTLTAGLALADDMPKWETRNINTELFGNASPKYNTEIGDAGAKGAAPGGVRQEKASKETTKLDVSNIFSDDDLSKDLP